MALFMKIHVPLQLENNMKNILNEMKLILALSKMAKKKKRFENDNTEIKHTAIYENEFQRHVTAIKWCVVGQKSWCNHEGVIDSTNKTTANTPQCKPGL